MNILLGLLSAFITMVIKATFFFNRVDVKLKSLLRMPSLT